jgi:hypothetical protein
LKRVVNCLQPHPFAAIILISGIDNDIKVFEPQSPQPCSLEFARGVAEENMRLVQLRNSINATYDISSSQGDDNDDEGTTVIPAGILFRLLGLMFTLGVGS